MSESIDVISREIVENRAALGFKLDELEKRVRARVGDSQEKIGETIEDITYIAHAVSPTYQVRQRPLLTVGGAAVAGFVFTQWLDGKPVLKTQPAENGVRPLQKLIGPFEAEIGMLKAILAGAALKLLAEKLKPSAPEVAEQVETVREKMGEKHFGKLTNH